MFADHLLHSISHRQKSNKLQKQEKSPEGVRGFFYVLAVRNIYLAIVNASLRLGSCLVEIPRPVTISLPTRIRILGT